MSDAYIVGVRENSKRSSRTDDAGDRGDAESLVTLIGGREAMMMPGTCINIYKCDDARHSCEVMYINIYRCPRT